MARALVPLKNLASAKTRLSGMLQPSERRALALAMVEDVLGVLSAHEEISEVTLVSDDPDAGDLAQRFGANYWSEQELNSSGLNAVVKSACERLVEEQGEGQGTAQEPLLVLHGDLPTLTVSDITAVLQMQRSIEGLVIGADASGAGTNLLAFNSASPPEFLFGENSCAAHLAWAQNAAVPVRLLQTAGIGLDIDEPRDLGVLLAALSGDWTSSTHRLLLGTELGSRLQLALASTEGLPINPTLLSTTWQAVLNAAEQGVLPSDEQALSLADYADTAALAEVAAKLRDSQHGNVVTYSRKVFIPLTHLCRDVCHYCTFAQTPKKIEQPYMPVEQVLALCKEAKDMGCQEALFTLGEKPELRYNAARSALAEMGYATTLEYLVEVAGRVLNETGLLPHINAGCMTAPEIAQLRRVSASMGIMLESASERLCEKGMPHYGSPDKAPQRRLETLELAGAARVPFTSGILIGIGETRRERIEALLALRATHQRFGHLQEVIVQNFRAKPNTLMSQAPEPDLNELLWTIAVARIIFGAQMNIQAPPNLSPGVLPQLVNAGINDWGGVSPLTPDHVNPEAPWPHLEKLAAETAAAGKFLEQRLTIYPSYIQDAEQWLDPTLRTAVMAHCDAAGFARRDNWFPGEEQPVPDVEARLLAAADLNASSLISDETPGSQSLELDPQLLELDPHLLEIVERCWQTATLSNADVTRLFNSRGNEFAYVVAQANRMRQQCNGDSVSYVVNRNINYTNVCYFKCQFCAFSKGKQSENLRGRPYDISGEDIADRCSEAWSRGATEVCMQGGIHPDYTGQTYLDIVNTVKQATPQMHVHAFSPLEIWQGAATLGIEVAQFIRLLRDAGLNTLPGTAAEVLHDDVRAVLCPDKINTQQWLAVMEAAHQAGLRTTATIMYGHVDQTQHWASHLLHIRELQQRTGGFTEFVPLPFVHMEAPMFLKGNARRGPTFREAILMHAVARLVFHGLIDNIQASWVKMGREGVLACLNAGVNDLGGTLMNESITRAAGTAHGQEWSPLQIESQIQAAGRIPRMRTTLYEDAPAEQHAAALHASPLQEVHGADAMKKQRSKRIASDVQPLRMLQTSSQPDTALYEQVVLMAACN